jgi:hypothetical protein
LHILFNIFFFRGESAFTTLVTGFGWAKNPMINRIHHLDKRIPITFIYGQNTWMDKSIGEMVKKDVQNCVQIKVNLSLLNLKIKICTEFLCR